VVAWAVTVSVPVTDVVWMVSVDTLVIEVVLYSSMGLFHHMKQEMEHSYVDAKTLTGGKVMVLVPVRMYVASEIVLFERSTSFPTSLRLVRLPRARY
jgi:hypothetical protein